jgi:DNA ligase (NAD+)
MADERNRRIVEALLGVLEVGDVREEERVGKLPLEGQKILFTGTLGSMTRTEAEARARELGGSPVKTVSKRLGYVVVGSDPGSKERKARELGVKVLSEAEWLQMADQKGSGSD